MSNDAKDTIQHREQSRLPQVENTEASRRTLFDEASRIEEDATFNFVGHYEAAAFWSNVSHLIGFPLAIFSAAAALTVFSLPLAATGLTILSTLLASASLYFKPAETSALHYRSGGKFKTLRDKARFYKEVQLLHSKASSAKLITILNDLYEEKQVISEMGVPIPNYAYKRARAKIVAGNTSYAIDGTPEASLIQRKSK